MVAGDRHEHYGDDRHAEDVPPGRHVRKERDHAHAEGVEETVDHEDAAVHDEDPAGRVGKLKTMLRNAEKKNANP